MKKVSRKPVYPAGTHKLTGAAKAEDLRKIAEAEALLAKNGSGDEQWERVTSEPTAPIAVRFSSPILEHLDKVAEAQGRTRSNLIQFIVREYLRTVAD